MISLQSRVYNCFVSTFFFTGGFFFSAGFFFACWFGFCSCSFGCRERGRTPIYKWHFRPWSARAIQEISTDTYLLSQRRRQSFFQKNKIPNITLLEISLSFRVSNFLSVSFKYRNSSNESYLASISACY